MTERPNLVAGDEDGTPLEDQDHLVNGRVPGKGSGLWTEDGDGAVTPASDQPLSVEKAKITQHSRRFTFSISQDQQGRLYATNAQSELVAGGPDQVNVSDSTDLGEMLEYLVNDLADFPPVISMGTRLNSDDRANYFFKTTASLDKIFNLFGAGRNKTQIHADPDHNLTNDILINIQTGGTDRAIMDWQQVKFTRGGVGGAYDTALKLNDARELNFEHVEFREHNSHPIILENVETQWNSMIDVWFLSNGAPPKIVNTGEWRIIGCSFRDTPDSIIFQDAGNIIRAGNLVGGNWVMNNSTFNDRTEEFGTIYSVNEKPEIDRLKYRHHAQINAIHFKEHGWDTDYTTKSTSGSGDFTIGVGTNRDELWTGTTSGSASQFALNSHKFTNPSYNFTRSASFGAGLSGDLDTASRVYLTAGDPTGGDYVGIVFEGDAVKAAASTGGTETLASLESPVGDTNVYYSVIWEDPTIEIYRQGDDLVGSHTFADGETPDSAPNVVLSTRIENGGDAVNYSIDTKMPSFTMVP